MQNKKRLGVQVRARRKARGFDSQKQLAEATGFQVSEATVQIIESGRRTVSSQTYSILEDFFQIPIGSMERLLAGEIKALPPSEDDPSASEETYTHGDQSYTKAEIRTLVRALGPKDFIAWALGPGESGPEATDQT
jgi:transcriptional regulator with XRE-family HTH domain